MNVNLIILGLISVLIGLIVNPFKSRTAREKRNGEKLGYTEVNFKVSGWLLLVVGILAVIYGLFNEE